MMGSEYGPRRWGHVLFRLAHRIDPLAPPPARTIDIRPRCAVCARPYSLHRVCPDCLEGMLAGN